VLAGQILRTAEKLRMASVNSWVMTSSDWGLGIRDWVNYWASIFQPLASHLINYSRWTT
jgi:hypothetical protein